MCIVLVLFIPVLFCLSCESDTDNTGKSLNQEDLDNYVAFAYSRAFWFIWNQNIAGTSTGAKDFTASGSVGGSVHVTGSAGVDGNGINTFDLSFAMTDYANSTEDTSVAFTGTVNCKGSFKNEGGGDDYTTIAHTSEHISYSGRVDTDDTDTKVEDSGYLGISETANDLSGTICGRDFGYSF